MKINFSFLIVDLHDQNLGYFCSYSYYDSANIELKLGRAIQSGSLSAVQSFLDSYYSSLASALSADTDNIKNVVTASSWDNYTNYYVRNISFETVADSQIDYTTILTNINTNLSNLNINIQNKNNQSDIVACLNNIFCYVGSNNNFISSIKSSNIDTSTDNTKRISNLIYALRRFISVFTTQSFDYTDSDNVSNKIVDNISKKISFLTPSQNNDNNSIFRILRIIALSLSNNSNVNLSSDSNVVSNASLKNISDKLTSKLTQKDVADLLEEIKLALINSDNDSIADTLTDIANKTTVNNIDVSNLIQVEGDLDYRIKYDNKKDE